MADANAAAVAASATKARNSAAIAPSSRPTALNPAKHLNGASSSALRQDTNGETARKVQQPKPQALPKRAGPASIIVAPRQKGNPIIANIKSMPWEYGDIPADYVLGVTTCALFLSLKYHRLHPEYIYTRIKQLQGKYNLRILLTMVDIQNHEDALKELSKTSLINNVTIILCWSAAEGGRYLELFKSYEFAAPTSIKAHQSTSFADKLVEFITVPRGVNKTDAVSLVSQFGTLRTSVNAQSEEVANVVGWGEKKVQRFCSTVRTPFRIQKAAKRGLARENTRGTPVPEAPTMSRNDTREESDTPDPPDAATARLGVGSPSKLNNSPSRAATATSGVVHADRRPLPRLVEDTNMADVFADEEEALIEAEASPVKTRAPSAVAAARTRKVADNDLDEGILAALSKLRKDG